MAEYVNVMEQKRRMCNSYALCSMGCPLNDIDFCNKNSGEKTNADFPEVEHRVMSWTAEHPEPVYPTWKEWLEEQRVVVHFDSVNAKGKKVKWELTNKSNCPIPADIAQKLGIEPKEG